MVKFLTTMGISTSIETIIRKARKKLVIVSPYLKLSKSLLERLQNADERVEEIIFIYGKEELKDNERENLFKLKKLKIFFHKNLHAKCYYNETQMVISSMNLHEFSERTNKEMGILITKDHEGDSEIFAEANQEVAELLNSSDTEEIKTSKEEVKEEVKEEKVDLHSQDAGYCIRCHETIKYNAEKPYCYDCFSIWNEYKNLDYIESYCHRCGRYNDSTMEKPLCYSCFKKK